MVVCLVVVSAGFVVVVVIDIVSSVDVGVVIVVAVTVVDTGERGLNITRSIFNRVSTLLY